MKIICFTIFMLFWMSCSNMPPKAPPEKIFPFGIYHHAVSVSGKDKKLSFSGINKWSKERFVVIGLGPFDMTMINYDENLTTSNKDLYVNKDFFSVSDDKVLKVVSLMKEIYSLDRSICVGLKCTTSYWGIPIELQLNEGKQVANIKIENGEYKINIDVTSFEKEL